MLKVKLSALLLLATCSFAQTWSGVLDTTRAVDWSKAGVEGGIPTRSTICANLSPGATGASITAAIAACPSGQVVKLSAGTYNITDQGIAFNSHSNVTLRGAGPDQTSLVFTDTVVNGTTTHQPSCGSNEGAVICVNGNANNGQSSGITTANWTAGYAKGTTTVTLSSTTGLSLGSIIILDQLDDASDTGNVYNCQALAATTCSTQGPGGQGRNGRGQMQIVKVTAISGGNVTITPGVYPDNIRTGQSPGAWWTGVQAEMDGVEDLSVDHSASTVLHGIEFDNAHNSWVHNVRTIKGQRNNVRWYLASHITVSDSYFFGTQNAASQSYGIELYGDSDCLAVNNIFQHIASSFIVDQTMGTVIAYNYAIFDFYSAFPPWMMPIINWHASGNVMDLVEGNVGTTDMADQIHGTANMITDFRNYFYGWENNKTFQTIPIHTYAFNRYFNEIGNVLGTAGYHNNYQDLGAGGSNSVTTIFNLNWSDDGSFGDSLVASTMMRWGNYDVFNNTVRFVNTEVPSGLSLYANAVPTTHNLPASFFLSAVPSWWPGTKAWPPIGPDVTTGTVGVCGNNGSFPRMPVTSGALCTGAGATFTAPASANGSHVFSNPAMDCFLNTMHGAPDGSDTNPLTFNATTCYSSVVTVPTVTTTTATSITQTTAVSGGTVVSTGGGSILSEGVCFNTTANPTTPCTSDGTTTPFTSSLTGLSANTLYHYRAFANNSAGNGFGSDLTFTTLPNAPTVLTISPNSGFSTGGTSTTITGTNFISVTSVTFGGVAATSFVVNSTTQITAVTPVHATGTVTITVINTGGSGSLVNGFTFTSLPPTCNAGWPSTSILIPTVSPAGYVGNTYRAGFPAQLDGSASVAGDGTSLSYVWQQQPSVGFNNDQQGFDTWSSHTVAKPTITGLVGGPWLVKLTVTQGNGGSASCYIYNGIVATDSNHTLIQPNDSLGQAIQTIIGNPVAYQQNPWLYYDNATKDVLMEFAGNYDLANSGTPINFAVSNGGWDTASTHGTVASIANNGTSSFTLTGTGTSFQTDICGGVGNTSFSNGMVFILWYQTGRTVSGVPETGRMPFYSGFCSSQTAIILNTVGSEENQGPNSWPQWTGIQVAAIGSQTNLNYSTSNTNGCQINIGACWWSSGVPPYYDPGQMFYEAYYRSGIDIWLQWARLWTDRFWRWPGIDRGVSVATGLMGGCQTATGCMNLDFGGLVLRALDNQIDNHPDMWAGMAHLYYWAARYIDKNASVPDLRIAGTGLMVLSYGALLDQNAGTYSTTWCPTCSLNYNIGTVSWSRFCRNAIHWSLSSIDNPLGFAMWPTSRDPIQKGWIAPWYIMSSYDTGQTWTGHLATLTNSSNSLTCLSCGWNSTMFSNRYDMSNSGNTCTSGTYCVFGAVTFCQSGALGDSSTCETQSYCLNGCSWNNATNTLTLDRPYQGASGTHNWMLPMNQAGTIFGSPNALTGFGQDSFMEGIAGAGFQLGALACAGAPAGCGATDGTTLAGYATDATNWLLNYAQTSNLYGISYLAGYSVCQQGATPPIAVPSTMKNCVLNLDSSIGAGEIAGDSVVGMIRQYIANPTASLKTFLDNWHGAMWAKTGVGTPPVPSPTPGIWDVNFDTDRAQCTVNVNYPHFTCGGGLGYYISANGALANAVGLSQKLSAQHFGISNEATWPTARLGGPLPSSTRTVWFSARLADVPGSTFFQVYLIPPSRDFNDPACGVGACTITCNTSPCSTNLDTMPGNYLYKILYSNGSKVLAQGDLQQIIVTVN